MLVHILRMSADRLARHAIQRVHRNGRRIHVRETQNHPRVYHEKNRGEIEITLAERSEMAQDRGARRMMSGCAMSHGGRV